MADKQINQIENLYRFGCYNEKKPEVCHLLADFLIETKKDYEQAGKVNRYSCDTYKDGRSCFRYGLHCLVEEGSKTADYPTAYGYFGKGCNFDDPFSCIHQAIMMATENNRIGVKQKVSKALGLMEESCAVGNAVACHYISDLHITGLKIGKQEDKEEIGDIPKDMKKAFMFAEKACELGYKDSCANLSLMYAKGDGVKENKTLSDKYKQRAKELQESQQQQQ